MVPSPGTPLGGERPRRARIGEGMDVDAPAAASEDVPMAPGAVAGPRLFCPVAGCPCADAARSRGWTSSGTLRMHVDAHLAGSLQGRVPAEWLQTRGAWFAASLWPPALGCTPPAGPLPELLPETAAMPGPPVVLLMALCRP